MGYPHWLVVPGRRRSSPHSCWSIWNGGAPITILCVLTSRCAWPLQSLANEVATVWPNAIGNVPQRWQLEGPTDGGRLARCSRVPCHRFPLERHSSQMWVLSHVEGRWMNVPAEELGWSLA